MFKVEVLMNGRKYSVEKTCSEFYALHKKLKKYIKTPEIPSKHVRTGSQNPGTTTTSLEIHVQAVFRR